MLRLRSVEIKNQSLFISVSSSIVFYLFLNFLFFIQISKALDSVEEIWAEAKDSKGNFAYYEQHIINKENGKLKNSKTYYFNEKGEVLASLNSDYRQSLSLPTYSFKNIRDHYEEGLKGNYPNELVTYKIEKDKKEESHLDKIENLYSCQGWHYFIIDNFSKVLNGDLFELKLLIPSKLDYYTFRLRKANKNEDILEVILEIDNFLLRIFAPSIKLKYNVKDKRLVFYEGISNIPNERGELVDVKIEYNISKPKNVK